MASPFDLITALYEQRMSDLVQQYNSGQIDLRGLHLSMKEEIRDVFLLQQRAGSDVDLTADDFLKLGNPIKQQDRFLSQFMRDVKAGNLSPDAIAARAKLYAQSSGQMYWLQFTDGLNLPVQPKVGTDCKMRCKCGWRIVRNADGSVDAYWELHANESCPTCVERQRLYNPFHVPAPRAERRAA